MNVRKYAAFQPMTAVSTESLKLVRFGDYYPSPEGITDPAAVVMETTVELPEAVADEMGFKEIVQDV
jgi:hypothetical protein